MDDLKLFLNDYDIKNGDSFAAKVIFKSRNLNNGEDCNRVLTAIYKMSFSGNITNYFELTPRSNDDISVFSEKDNIFIYKKYDEDISKNDLLIITGCKGNKIYAYIFYEMYKI